MYKINMEESADKILETVLSVVESEVSAVLKIKEVLTGKISEIIVRLSGCRGRIIVSGVGKCGFIARKMVATLNSTGTPAVFLHCADAVHGDLGMVQKDDIVIIISKSGNTPEVKRLVPLIKGFGNYIVSMVSDRDSYLARHSDDIIYLPVEKEAGPDNLAPTSSTTVQLVMADAIAVCLAGIKNFGKDDFARFHPGGSLGKRLYMTVGDILDKNNVPSVSPDDTVPNTIINISAHRLGATVVLDDSRRILGIITDGDVRRMVERGGDFNSMKASDIMSTNPKTTEIGTLAVDALAIMERNEITTVVVLDGGGYAGLVHIHDIMKEGIV